MVSVIVPVYNVSTYLRECVDSIMAQTITDWELILIDDGSTDGSGEMCEQYASADSRIKVLHTRNAGPSVARNMGLDICSGDYISFVDSDDAIHPMFMERLLKVAESTGCDVVAGDYVRSVDCRFPKLKKTDYVVEAPTKVLEKILYQKYDSSVWGKIYSARLFSSLRFIPGIWYEDLLMCMSLYCNAVSIARISDKLYFYRLRPDSFVCSYSPGRFDILRVTDRIAERAARISPRMYRAALDRRFSAACNVLLMLYKNKVDDPEYESMCREVIKELRSTTLMNANVRLKSRFGAMLSYFSVNIFKLLAQWR